MYPSEDPVARLARRLKDLRLNGFAGQKLTQQQLGQALDASTPLISSWESPTNPKIPPQARLDAYATFFATPRSVTGRRFHLLHPSDLTSAERAGREKLVAELTALRAAALGLDDDDDSYGDNPLGNLWRFPPGEDITIICAELPDPRKQMDYSDPGKPDFVRAYGFSDLDALIELYGHLRAANPTSQVTIRSSQELLQEHFTAHLAVLGGVDFNPITAQLIRQISAPVQQIMRETDADMGGFVVIGEERVFRPEVIGEGKSAKLEADISYFYRGSNPFNRERTVTMCNGQYARGVLGSVRALTDARMRDRNETYVRERFGGATAFSILARVIVVNDEVVPPDWTSPTVRLHEWHDLRA